MAVVAVAALEAGAEAAGQAVTGRGTINPENAWMIGAAGAGGLLGGVGDIYSRSAKAAKAAVTATKKIDDVADAGEAGVKASRFVEVLSTGRLGNAAKNWADGKLAKLDDLRKWNEGVELNRFVKDEVLVGNPLEPDWVSNRLDRIMANPKANAALKSFNKDLKGLAYPEFDYFDELSAYRKISDPDLKAAKDIEIADTFIKDGAIKGVAEATNESANLRKMINKDAGYVGTAAWVDDLGVIEIKAAKEMRIVLNQNGSALNKFLKKDFTEGLNNPFAPGRLGQFAASAKAAAASRLRGTGEFFASAKAATANRLRGTGEFFAAAKAATVKKFRGPADTLLSPLDRLASSSPMVRSKSAQNALSPGYFENQNRTSFFQAGSYDALYEKTTQNLSVSWQQKISANVSARQKISKNAPEWVRQKYPELFGQTRGAQGRLQEADGWSFPSKQQIDEFNLNSESQKWMTDVWEKDFLRGNETNFLKDVLQYRTAPTEQSFINIHGKYVAANGAEEVHVDSAMKVELAARASASKLEPEVAAPEEALGYSKNGW